MVFGSWRLYILLQFEFGNMAKKRNFKVSFFSTLFCKLFRVYIPMKNG